MKKLLVLASLILAVSVNATPNFQITDIDGTAVDMGTIDSTISSYKAGFDGKIRFYESNNFKLDATILKLNYGKVYESYDYKNEWGYITPSIVLDLKYGK